ncbi:MAG: phospho-N-acetylmuramoyl-pentapeptide-transferase [Lachnospirales bacterium]
MNLFTEIILPITIVFGISTVIAPFAINFLKKLKVGQQVRTDGPQTHLSKSGTPTIGGLIFLFGILVTSLFFIDKVNVNILVFMALCGIIGFIDDFAKVKKKQSLGLDAKQKIVAQFLASSAFLFLLWDMESLTTLIIPFTNKSIDLGVFYYPFFYIFTIGVVNAVNITDGLDGLAAGVTALVAMFFGFALLSFGSEEYLLPFIVLGALVSFLIFNYKPAKVFMGDTGSLALGAFVAGIATVSHMQFFIVIAGIIYLVESLSVMIQTGYFKYTKKKYGEGRRVFKMAPYHHHLEKKGLGEKEIVLRFYIITTIGCLISYLAL